MLQPSGFERVKLIELKVLKSVLPASMNLQIIWIEKEQVKRKYFRIKKAGAQLIIVNFHWGK